MFWTNLVWAIAIIFNLVNLFALAKKVGGKKKFVLQVSTCFFTLLAAVMNAWSLPPTIIKWVTIFVAIVGMLVAVRELWIVWKNK